MGVLNDGSDQPQYGRIGRRIERRDQLVTAVHSQGVLGQVVRADAEEIDVAGQHVRGQGRRGRLDHDADGDVAVVRDGFVVEILHHVVQDHLGLHQLVAVGDQREHDLDLAEDRGPQDGAQLGLEHHQVRQAEADGAQAEKRVRLGRETHALGVLVGAEVERSDDDGPVFEDADGAGVGLVVVLLGRLALRVEVEEFGAVQADAVAAFLQDDLGFVGKFDVA